MRLRTTGEDIERTRIRLKHDEVRGNQQLCLPDYPIAEENDASVVVWSLSKVFANWGATGSARNSNSTPWRITSPLSWFFLSAVVYRLCFMSLCEILVGLMALVCPLKHTFLSQSGLLHHYRPDRTLCNLRLSRKSAGSSQCKSTPEERSRTSSSEVVTWLLMLDLDIDLYKFCIGLLTSAHLWSSGLMITSAFVKKLLVDFLFSHCLF